MKYLIYLRVSTDKQDVDMQKKLCLEYLARQPEKHPYKIYNEGDLSTQIKVKKRPKLQQMLQEINPGDTVLLYNLDRLDRDHIEMVILYRKIKNDLKAKLHSLTDEYQDEFTVGLMGVIAHREREKTREKTRNALKAKKQDMHRTGTVPYGFTLDQENLILVNGPEHGRKVLKPGKLIPLSQEQEVLSVMCRLFDEGKSFRQIANSLNDQGYRNRKGNPFQHMSIYRILSRTGLATSTSPLLRG